MQVADMGIVEKMFYDLNTKKTSRITPEILQDIFNPAEPEPKPTIIKLSHMLMPSLFLLCSLFVASLIFSFEITYYKPKNLLFYY